MIDLETLPEVVDADIVPSQLLLVELQTRITTQPLHYRSGDEESAAKSVYELFPTTRTLLEEHLQAGAFATVAVFLLNRLLRANTARWHRWMVDDKFADEQARRRFRYELQQLQTGLREFALLLDAMARKDPGVPQKYRALLTKNPAPGGRAEMGGNVRAGMATVVPLKSGPVEPGRGTEAFLTAGEIDAAEHHAIRARRAALARRPVDEHAAVENAAGLCLSGGGIRSATFCLGIVQVLARQKLLSEFDYLSTVSGGGYLGAFISSYLGTPPAGEPVVPAPDIKEAIKAAFSAERGNESGAIRHLRNNSRYLLSGGIWARLKIVGLLITGILTNILLMLPLPLVAVLAVGILYSVGYWSSGWTSVAALWVDTPGFSVFAVIGIVLAVGWLALPLARNQARGLPPEAFAARFRSALESALIILGLGLLVAGLLVLVPPVFNGISGLPSRVDQAGSTLLGWSKSESAAAILTALAPILLGLGAAHLKEGAGKKWITSLFALSGPLLGLVVFLAIGSHTVGPHALSPTAWIWVASIAFALTLWGWLFVDLNEFSPHGYYRDRLCECYLVVRQNSQRSLLQTVIRRIVHGRKKGETFADARIGTRNKLPLSQMNATGVAPYHLINAAVNLPASREPNLRGRDCDFFTFTRDYCGGPVCGYVKTTTIERLDPHVDLGTAMAVSGAAASSNMGVKTMRQFRFLLALLNIRLGYWLRNPIVGPRHWWNVPGPRYLFREMTGWMHEKTAYLNLSDGGHIENLALYEMLRRRCKYIVVIDGGQEPGMECADLLLAQRYAQIDLGVQFELDLADLALNAQHYSRAYAAFGKVQYSARADGTGAADVGWIVYLKLARTGSEPGYVTDYARQNPDFPHQSTAEQLYGEAQFEAYRRLGECAAESLFRPEISDPYRAPRPDFVPNPQRPPFETLGEWFQALAGSLLADNDPALRPRAIVPQTAAPQVVPPQAGAPQPAAAPQDPPAGRAKQAPPS